jgi:hypothetical protein
MIQGFIDGIGAYEMFSYFKWTVNQCTELISCIFWAIGVQWIVKMRKSCGINTWKCVSVYYMQCIKIVAETVSRHCLVTFSVQETITYISTL